MGLTISGVTKRLQSVLLGALALAPSPGMTQQLLDGVVPPGGAAQILRVHNTQRRTVGVPPLRWDEALAVTALQCAQQLAASRQFHHCRSGENLWMGTAGRYLPAEMVELWATERHDFQNGIFPAVSRNSSWQAVGHYTQMVWRTTTTLGCAVATGGDGLTRLVCHYAPPGNIIGRPVY